MKRILLASAVLVAAAAACYVGQKGGDVSRELADDLTDSIKFEGGTEIRGARPQEHPGDPAYPQVTAADAPSDISAGQAFQITLYTEYDETNGAVTGAIIAIEKNGVEADGYVDVAAKVETWGRRKSMRLYGRLSRPVAETTEEFVLKIAMHRADGRAGNYYEWRLAVAGSGSSDGGAADSGFSPDASTDGGGADTGIVWVSVGAGTFVMGCSTGDTNCYDFENQPHQVTVGKAFWIMAGEVTQGQYAAWAGGNPSYYSGCGDGCPVDSVSWAEAALFCKNIGGRLPTEAEWEFAARAGTATELYTGRMTVLGLMNSPELDPISRYGGNSGVGYAGGLDCSAWQERQYEASRCGPGQGALKQANGLGLYDMLGNVWEWVEDDWHDGYAGAPSDGSAWVDTPRSEKRVLRGGAWDSNAVNVRVSVRGGFEAAGRYDDFGFRCARD